MNSYTKKENRNRIGLIYGIIKKTLIRECSHWNNQRETKKKEEIDTYKQSVLENFKAVPYGERFIIRTILEI